MSPEILAAKLQSSWKQVTPTLVAQWEDGIEQPSPQQVRKLAEIYKRPIAVFLLSRPRDDNPIPPDRRTIGSKTIRAFSAATLLMIRRVRAIQERATELQEDLGHIQTFRYHQHTIAEDPTDLATRIRAEVDLPINTQLRASTYAVFFDRLRGRLEETGILVLKSGGHRQFPCEEARALSFTDRQPFAILVNNKDYEGAKNFSVVHEFGHILVRQPGICNDFTSFNASNDRIDPVEVFCNQFAASFLVPRHDLLAHRLISGRSRILPDELDNITERLARDFKVSRLVILRRLLTLEIVSRDTYKHKSAEWEKDIQPPGTGGRTIPARLALQTNGATYSGLVVEAFRRNKISRAAASEYLGTKSRHLNAVDSLLHADGR